MSLLAVLTAVAAAAQSAGDFLAEEEGELLGFSYGWPAAAEAVPALRDRLRQEMEAARVEATGYAEEGRRDAAASGYDFNPHYFVKTWQLAGRTPRLLSLSASRETYSGGAHGNVGFSGLLWDVEANAAIEAAAVLGPEALERLAPRYCEALDAERAERRGEPVRPEAEDSFTTCPALAEQVLVPEDEDGNGRFERIAVLIPPYVAGPYAEGPYPLEVALGEEDVAAIDATHRSAFEPAPAQAAGD